MAVKDTNIHPNARIGVDRISAAIVTALSLTGAVVWSFLPGYKFQLTLARSFCRTKAGTVTAVIKIGSRTAATIVFTAATEVAGTLSTTLANLRGSATEAITIELTTDGSGVLTNSHIVLGFRPIPMVGEAVTGQNTPG
jgi:hypothetical protein